MLYDYISVNRAGKTKKGRLQGSSVQHIRQQLLAGQETLLDIHPVSERSLLRGIFRSHVSIAALAILTYQFAALLSAGIPVISVTEEIAGQMDHPYLKSVILILHKRLLEGESLYHAMNEFPEVFPEIYRATIAAGEKTGRLVDSFNKLSRYLEQYQHTKGAIQQAMIYPVLLTSVSLVIIGYMLEYTIPTITKTFTDTHHTLPAATQILINICNGVREYGLFVAISGVIAVSVFLHMMKKDRIRYSVQTFLLKVPILGLFFISINSARFTRTLAMLMSAGIPIVEAMRNATQVLTLLPMKQSMDHAISDITSGNSLCMALDHTGYFSKIIIRLIASGESGGRLDMMLEKAADYQDQKISQWIAGFLAVFQPLIILIMGMVVLFIGVASLLPIFQMNEFLSP